MEATFTLDEDDFYQLNRYLLLRAPGRRRSLALTSLTVGLVVTLVNYRGSIITALVFGVLTAVLIIPAIGLGIKRGAYRTFRQMNDPLKTATVSLSPSGFRSENAVAGLNMDWTAVADVAQDEKEIYLVLDKRQSIVIPKRVFPDAAAATAFFDTARSFWQKARQPMA